MRWIENYSTSSPFYSQDVFEGLKGVVTNYGEEGRGGTTKREVGHVKFYSHEKGGGKSFSHAEGVGGDTTSFGVVFTQKLEVLAILKGGAKVSTL